MVLRRDLQEYSGCGGQFGMSERALQHAPPHAPALGGGLDLDPLQHAISRPGAGTADHDQPELREPEDAACGLGDEDRGLADLPPQELRRAGRTQVGGPLGDARVRREGVGTQLGGETGQCGEVLRHRRADLDIQVVGRAAAVAAHTRVATHNRVAGSGSAGRVPAHRPGGRASKGRQPPRTEPEHRVVSPRPTCDPASTMTDAPAVDHRSISAERPLVLRVGCTFGLRATQDAQAIVQVAPRPQPGLSIRGERWDAAAHHHCYVDHYGNRCERFALTAGSVTIRYEAELALSHPADLISTATPETPVASLPDDVLSFVMPSRFCLPDELGHEAWQRFGALTPGWGRVQAIVDHVHDLLLFTPGASNPWTTAADAYRARQGVCRDFAHLAITFCRALNIPARYVFGYIPDIDVPPPAEPMDFAAWFEAYLDGAWHTFDARNNTPRTGRVVVGRGRDAVDVALITSFGPLTLSAFEVRAERVSPTEPPPHD